MTKYTEVMNISKRDITLKQCYATMFSVVCELPPCSRFNIRVDESTRYCEFWCFVQPTSDPDQELEVFNLDDWIEFKEVRIFEEGHQHGRCKWEGISRHENPLAPKPSLLLTAEQATQAIPAQHAQATSTQEVQTVSIQQAPATSAQQAAATSAQQAQERGRGDGAGTDVERILREVEDIESQGQDRSGLPMAYLQIRNELWAENHPVYGTALKRWDRMNEYLGIRIERKKTRRAELNTDIFNIVGFFSVFQGVVLTAVSQLKSDTHSTCGLVWFPIILSCLAAVAAIGGVSLRFLTLGEVAESIKSDAHAVRSAVTWAQGLRNLGKDFRFYQHAEDSKFWTLQNSFPIFKFSLVIFALILFTGIFILSYFAILCNRFIIVKWVGGF